MILDYLLDSSRIEPAKSKALLRSENKEILGQARECLRKVERERILAIDLSELPFIEVHPDVIKAGCTVSFKTIVGRFNQKYLSKRVYPQRVKIESTLFMRKKSVMTRIMTWCELLEMKIF